jgi:hypothetical protein
MEHFMVCTAGLPMPRIIVGTAWKKSDTACNNLAREDLYLQTKLTLLCGQEPAGIPLATLC